MKKQTQIVSNESTPNITLPLELRPRNFTKLVEGCGDEINPVFAWERPEEFDNNENRNFPPSPPNRGDW
jgi:hypothetical protein